MIDSHCHLADPKFDADRNAVIQRAITAGVTTMVTIADDIGEAEKCVEIAEKHDHIFCTVGVHPHKAKEWDATSGATLRKLAQSKKVRAIGEIGLDYHYDFSPRDVQRDVFRKQLSIAAELQLPVVIHCREAVGDVKAILNDFPTIRFVLHCCTERWNDVENLVARGGLLSFTGIATYAKSDDVRDTIKRCPIEQLMIETDAPYLAPVPHRGKRNEPAYVLEVAKAVATIKGLTLEEVDAATTRNAVEFFNLRS